MICLAKACIHTVYERGITLKTLKFITFVTYVERQESI